MHRVKKKDQRLMNLASKVMVNSAIISLLVNKGIITKEEITDAVSKMQQVSD